MESFFINNAGRPVLCLTPNSQNELICPDTNKLLAALKATIWVPSMHTRCLQGGGGGTPGAVVTAYEGMTARVAGRGTASRNRNGMHMTALV
mmetsp:Transcript_102692/g.177249  ORF Transcript_102692/g.177249 Transcript_102692/m.177249 type:complete len:92 (-) Transcript_102692:283-558(-)